MENIENPDFKFIFFGTSEFSVIVLNELFEKGLKPELIITTPDKPQGRKMVLTPSPVKIWSESKGIEIYQPEKLNDEEIIKHISSFHADVFLVASYGKIIPLKILDIPDHGALNIHPSLLPKYRGASPLQSAILDDEKNTGVTLMLMDAQMDHGPIIAQEKIALEKWPLEFNELEKVTAILGADMFVKHAQDWIDIKIKPEIQDESNVTFTKKITKEDGLINISEIEDKSNNYKNFLKFCAFKEWPGIYYFIERNNKKIRVVIKDAEYTDGKFIIKKVIPEGKKLMEYKEFLKGFK